MGKKSVSIETKWMIIGAWQTNTKNNCEIARQFDVSETCVHTTIRNFLQRNDATDSPRCGRPRKITEQDERYIFRKSRQNPFLSNRNLAKEFNSINSGYTVSRETVRKILLSRGIGSYTAQRKPLLRVTDRIKRRKWCKERLNWSVEEWSRVIFSDESNFQVFNRKSKVMVKRLGSEKYDTKFCVPRLQGGGGSVGIWGCISHKGIGYAKIYDGRIDQYAYKDTLESCLKPSISTFYGRSKNYYFQQDGASAHTAKSVQAYFEGKKIRVLP
jgi:transposase